MADTTYSARGNGEAFERAFLAVSALVFAVSAALTVVWCGSMSAMGGMAMPGGWTMSMAWMLMRDQTWLGAESSFVGMWVVMMAAMMLPSLVPMLVRYRAIVAGTSGRRLAWLTFLVGAGYFSVWTVIGSAVFPLGIAVSEFEMEHSEVSRAVPLAIAMMVLAIGAIQITTWKARCLACCREMPCHGQVLPAMANTAWRHGLRLGVQCASCCGSLMALQVVLGVMDVRLMAGVTAAITAERLAPSGDRVARAIGVAIVGAGLFLIVRAAGLV